MQHSTWCTTLVLLTACLGATLHHTQISYRYLQCTYTAVGFRISATPSPAPFAFKQGASAPHVCYRAACKGLHVFLRSCASPWEMSHRTLRYTRHQLCCRQLPQQPNYSSPSCRDSHKALYRMTYPIPTGLCTSHPQSACLAIMRTRPCGAAVCTGYSAGPRH